MIKRRVFLSFDSDDVKQVRGLRLMAANPNFDVEFYDKSLRIPVNSLDAVYIKSVIREKIKRSSVTLCLVGESTYKSEWVDWELNESEKQENSIVAMTLKGIESVTFPRYLKNNKITVYEWNHDYLKTLINEA